MNDRPKIEIERQERYAIWGFAALAFLVRIPLAFGPPAALTSRYGDDAFYILSVARNFAAGRGITIDGTHLTNGFQPLIAALYAAAFLFSPDAWTAVRVTVLLNAAIFAVATVVVASVARSLCGVSDTKFWQRPAVLAAFFWTCSISVFHQTTTGLETCLYSLCLLLVIREYLSEHRSALRLGILLGVCVLARIDAAILVAAIVLIFFFQRSYRDAIMTGLLAVLVSLPWWIYNIVNFGNLMPTSGQAEVSWPTSMTEQISRLLETLTDIVLIFGYTPHDLTLPSRVVVALVLSVVLIVVVRKFELGQLLHTTRTRELLPFWIFGAALVLYYTFYFRAPHFIIRYLHPLRILVLIVSAVAVSKIIKSYSSQERKSIVFKLCWIGFLILSIGFSVNRYVAFYDKSQSVEFYDMGIWASAHPTDRIGMLQSGIAGFVAPNVINLDGKVNTEALRAHQQGHLGSYIRRDGFTYLADWKPFVEDVAKLCREDELFFDSVGMMGRIQVMKRR